MSSHLGVRVERNLRTAYSRSQSSPGQADNRHEETDLGTLVNPGAMRPCRERGGATTENQPIVFMQKCGPTLVRSSEIPREARTLELM